MATRQTDQSSDETAKWKLFSNEWVNLKKTKKSELLPVFLFHFHPLSHRKYIRIQSSIFDDSIRRIRLMMMMMMVTIIWRRRTSFSLRTMAPRTRPPDGRPKRAHFFDLLIGCGWLTTPPPRTRPSSFVCIVRWVDRRNIDGKLIRPDRPSMGFFLEEWLKKQKQTNKQKKRKTTRIDEEDETTPPARNGRGPGSSPLQSIFLKSVTAATVSTIKGGRPNKTSAITL